MQPYATDNVSLGSAEEPYDSDMTHSYRLTEGRLIRYPMIHAVSASHCFIVHAWQTSRLVISPHSVQLFTSDLKS